MEAACSRPANHFLRPINLVSGGAPVAPPPVRVEGSDMGAAAAFEPCDGPLSIERIIEAARRTDRPSKNRAKARLAETGLIAALLGLEGCKTIGDPGPDIGAPSPAPLPSPPSGAPAPERLAVGENMTTDIPVADLLAAIPGAAAISKIVSWKSPSKRSTSRFRFSRTSAWRTWT